jgi:hypothetical protein
LAETGMDNFARVADRSREPASASVLGEYSVHRAAR